MIVAACTVRPEPITPAEHVQRAEDDYKAILSANVPIDHPLTLADVIARALKYNYDAVLAQQKISLQEQQFDVAMAGLLPRLALNAGYNARSNDPAAQSIDERTRQVSLEYAFSEEPTHFTAGPEFTWTVLDFGLSYFQAKQQGYLAYVSVERRRKVIADIVKRVQDAYWRALVANDMLPKLQPLLARAEKALAMAKEATRLQLSPDLPTLEFQREMVTVVGQLRQVESDLRNARAQLTTLISLPTNANLELAKTNWDLTTAPQAIDNHKLEELGLALRPELREEGYQEKIDRQDVYKEIMKMMPGVGILSNFNYDSNKYLFNSTWGSVGIQASYNLANLIRGPRALAAARQALAVSKTRRLALSMAVISQINLAFQQYEQALEQMNTAHEVLSIERKIAKVAAASSEADSISDAERVRRELSTELSELDYFHAVTQVRYALVSLYISCGVDLVPASVDIDDLNKAAREVAPSIVPWVDGEPPDETLPAPSGPAPS